MTTIDETPEAAVAALEAARARVDREVAAVSQVTRAIAAAEEALARRVAPWSWGEGIAIVRRLESALASHAAAATRAAETSPGEPAPARRAVAATLLALATMRSVGASLAARRATAHATLAVCLEGLRARDGAPIADAADALVARMARAPAETTGMTPHRLQTTAIVHLLGSASPLRPVRLRVVRLVELLYALERARCPADIAVDLTRVEALAYVARRAGPWGAAEVDEAWLHVVVDTVGEVPPGTWVRLPDGYVGVAIGPSASGDPSRPEVLADGISVVPDEPVRLVAPGARVGGRCFSPIPAR